MEKEYWAHIYGGEFPVCSKEQKEKLEAAFQSSVEYEKTNEPFKQQCYCDLLIALHSPDTPRAAIIAAGYEIARRVYAEKMVISTLGDMIQERAMQNVSTKGGMN